MNRNFQKIGYLRNLYKSRDIITLRGNFLKKYSNRKYSLRSLIIKLLPKLNNVRILDIGCGDGSFLKKLHDLYPKNRYYGLDIIENYFCKKLLFLNYRIYNGFIFPKYKNKFDLIFCLHMLYHIENLKNFFKQIKNILNKKGIIVISTKSKYTFPKMESIFKDIINKMNLDSKYKIKKTRDESKFCLENGSKILKRYFLPKIYKIQLYTLETQIMVNNRKDLLDYIFSTQRYNLSVYLTDKNIIKKYKNLWTNYISDKLFIDKYIEIIYIISKT